MYLLTRTFALTAALLAGCSQTPSICEVDVEGVLACIETGVGDGFCKSEWNGTPHDKDTTTCNSLGYTVDCSGRISEIGGNYTADHAFSVTDEADCAEADGKVFADHS